MQHYFPAFKITVKLSLSILLLHQNSYIFYYLQMQNGSHLHIALLRKISHLTSTPNYRERFNQFKRKQELVKYDLMQNDQTIDSVGIPLTQLNVNRFKNKSCLSKQKTRSKMPVQNITISAWSIDGAHEVSELERDTRYNKKRSQNIQNLQEHQTNIKPIEPLIRKRHFSQGHSIFKKKPMETELQTLSNIQKERKKSLCKQITSKQNFNRLKHINISIICDKENSLSQKLNYSTCSKQKQQCKRLDTKLPSFDAFVSDLKAKVRNKWMMN